MRGSKGVLGLSIAAALAVGVTTSAATAGASAVAVKAKRCRVHGVPVIKKSCKKPVSLVRATLTWSGGDLDTDYDLYVFGNHGTSTTSTSNGNGITKSKISKSEGPSGTATFTDQLWRRPGARSFRFGVCHQNGTLPVTYTIDYVTTNGRHHTDSQTGGEGFNAVYGNDGGAPALGTMVCPRL
jgi:hypothetical protein